MAIQIIVTQITVITAIQKITHTNFPNQKNTRTGVFLIVS
jgi:hypothetical protein